MSTRQKIDTAFLVLLIGLVSVPVIGKDDSVGGVSAEDIEIVRNLDVLEEMELLESLDLAESYETTKDAEGSQIKGDDAHEEDNG